MFVLIERSFVSCGCTMDVFSFGISVTSQFCVFAKICDGTKFSCDVLSLISVKLSDDLLVLKDSLLFFVDSSLRRKVSNSTFAASIFLRTCLVIQIRELSTSVNEECYFDCYLKSMQRDSIIKNHILKDVI